MYISGYVGLVGRRDQLTTGAALSVPEEQQAIGRVDGDGRKAAEEPGADIANNDGRVASATLSARDYLVKRARVYFTNYLKTTLRRGR